MAVFYDDRRLVLDDDALTIYDYYFPRGARRIMYRDLRGVDDYAMSLWTGKLLLWGTLDLMHWFHFDPLRPQKQRAISLNLGGWIRPVITPDDPETVANLLRQKISAASGKAASTSKPASTGKPTSTTGKAASRGKKTGS